MHFLFLSEGLGHIFLAPRGVWDSSRRVEQGGLHEAAPSLSSTRRGVCCTRLRKLRQWDAVVSSPPRSGSHLPRGMCTDMTSPSLPTCQQFETQLPFLEPHKSYKEGRCGGERCPAASGSPRPLGCKSTEVGLQVSRRLVSHCPPLLYSSPCLWCTLWPCSHPPSQTHRHEGPLVRFRLGLHSREMQTNPPVYLIQSFLGKSIDSGAKASVKQLVRTWRVIYDLED